MTCIENVFGMVEKMNHGLLRLYNVVILGKVEHVMEAKSWVLENRGRNVEVGYFCTANIERKSGTVYMGGRTLLGYLKNYVAYHTSKLTEMNELNGTRNSLKDVNKYLYH